MSGTVSAPPGAPPAGSGRAGARAQAVGRALATWYLAGVVVAVVLVVAVAEPAVLRPANLRNVLVNASILSICGMGTSIAIAAGLFDLSVGAVVSLSSVILAVTVVDVGLAGALLLVALGAVAVGLVNGFVVTRLRITSFVATLAMLVILRGVLLVATDGRRRLLPGNETIQYLTAGTVAGVPVPLIITGAVAAGAWYLVHRTAFGRHLLAVGAAPDSARTVGLHVDRVRVAVLVLVSLSAALWGVLTASQVTLGSATVGDGFELQAITVAIVGGTALTGGRTALAGTFLGALLLGVTQNALNLLDAGPAAQRLAVGGILVAALAVNTALSRLRGEAGRPGEEP